MKDPQYLVDRIQQFLKSGDLVLEADTPEIADDYATWTRETNRRLRMATDHLHAGYRSEGLHLSDVEPDVIRLEQILDLGEDFERWEEVCQTYDLGKPEEIRHELVRFVEQAHVELDEHHDFLDEYRKLSLALAPLPRRIAVLRKLVANDPNTGFWADDLQDFESARLKEIPGEAKELLAERDVSGVKALLAEVESPDWSEPPAPKLVKSIQTNLAKLVALQSRAQLKTLAPEMQQAHSERNIDRARELARQWTSIAPRARLAPEDRLLLETQPILAWVADEDRNDAAEKAHQNLIREAGAACTSTNVDLQTLENYWQQLYASQRDVPPETQALLQNTMQKLRTGRGRQRLALVATVVTVVVGIGTTAGIVGYRQLRAQKMGRFITDLRSEIDAGNSLTAQERYEELNRQNGYTHEDWLALGRELDELNEGERERVDRLDLVLLEIGDRIEQIPDEAPGVFQAIENDLESATTLVKAEPEKNKLTRLERNYRRAREDFLTERTRRGEALISEVTEQLDAAEKLLADGDWRVAGRSAEQIHSRLESIKNYLSAGDEKQSGVAALRQRIGKIREEVLQRKTRGDFVKRYDSLSTKPSQSLETWKTGLEETLTDRVAELGGQSPGDDYKQALKEVPLWVSVVTAERLKRQWADAPVPSQAGAIKERIETANKFSREHSRYVVVTVLPRYARYLESIEDRRGVPDQLMNVAFGKNRFGQQLWLLVHNGKKYYLRDRPEEKSVKIVRYTTSLNLEKDLKSQSFTPAIDATVQRAPITSFVSRLNTRLDGADADVLPDVLYDMMRMTLGDEASAKSVDPVARLFILKYLFDIRGEVDAPFWVTPRSIATSISRIVPISYNWLDPDAAPEVRQKAQEYLNSFPDDVLKQAHEGAEERREQLFASLGQTYHPVGWLDEREGTWIASGFEPPSDRQVLNLFVLLPTSPSPRWKRVGSWSPGSTAPTFDLSAAGPEAFVKGRLVFVERPASP